MVSSGPVFSFVLPSLLGSVSILCAHTSPCNEQTTKKIREKPLTQTNSFSWSWGSRMHLDFVLLLGPFILLLVSLETCSSASSCSDCISRQFAVNGTVFNCGWCAELSFCYVPGFAICPSWKTDADPSGCGMIMNQSELTIIGSVQ